MNLNSRLYGLFLCCVLLNPVLADDDLLLLVPAIVSATAEAEVVVPGLEKIKDLNGMWNFTAINELGEIENFYRFDQETAAQDPADPSIFVIEAQGSTFEDFFSDWCDGGSIGSYSSEFDSYIVLCNWGFPDTDFGSLWAFSSVSNSFPLEHFFYVPSTGEVQVHSSSGTGSKLSNSPNALGAAKISTSTEFERKLVRREARILEIQRQLNLLSETQYTEFDATLSTKAQQLRTHLSKVLKLD